MKTSVIIYTDRLGTPLYTRRWLPDGTPKAVVVISHGMGEHSERYGRFAERLVASNYAVYAHDHRGHGKTAQGEAELGYFADKNGFDAVIGDLHEIIGHAKAETACAKAFLFGHSMGSLFAQTYMERHGEELSGCILSATFGDMGPVVLAGRLIAALGCLFKGPKAKAKLLDAMSFGSFNKPFEPARTKFEWLSRDPAEVDKYVADPLCGFVCTNEYWRDSLPGLAWTHKEANMRKIPRKLPIYLYGGEFDPVGVVPGSFDWLYERYKALGIADLSKKIYPGARHETLNETNRDEVMADVIAWLDAR